VLLHALTGLNGQSGVGTSDWITAGACLRGWHSSLTVQQLPLNFLWIQLLSPTSKYNHSDILQKVNNWYCSCQGQKASLSASLMHSSLITALHNSARERDVPLAVSVHFHFFCLCLPTQPHSVSPPASRSRPASLKAECVIRLNTCCIMMLTIPRPFC